MRGDRESLDYTSYTCWTWPFVGSVNKPSVEAWWRVVVVEEDGDGFVVVVVVVVVAGNESKLNAAATKKGRNTAASTPPFRVYVNLVLLQRDGSSERSLTEYEPSRRIA